MHHTPGQWTYDTSDMGVYNDMGTGICKIHRQVKVAGVDDLEKFGPSTQTIANAALICAAPELVTRLYNLVNELDVAIHGGVEITSRINLRLTEARELIKKLTP
jgi:hypothetical protein